MQHNPSAEQAHEIPWGDLARFHRAIVQRAEEGFWSLDPRDISSERWSSLGTFSPTDLDGPWTIELDVLQSVAFRRQLEQPRVETVFLGGGGFFGTTGTGSDRTECWHPLFYREVQIVSREDGVELRPLSDAWELSPPAQKQFDRLQFKPELEEATASEYVLAATRKLLDEGGRTVAEAAVAAVLQLVPDMGPVLAAKPASISTAVSTWVLFSPPSQIGPFNRHLVRDYNALERLLDAGGEGAAGGLDLLQSTLHRSKDARVEVLPFVAKNAAQEQAVSTMLAGRRVTVVSGPPGCGKSQVVVSLLLNAWAKGQSVLFASNNNKAVDVVWNRLLPFESDQPIAIRAGGSSTKNNVVSTLRRVLQAASSHQDIADAVDLEVLWQIRRKLRAEQQRLEEDLHEGSAQRILEAAGSAFEIYAASRNTLARIEQRVLDLSDRCAAIVGDNRPLDTVPATLESTRAWLQRVVSIRDGVAIDTATRAAYEAERATRAASARASFAACQIDDDVLDDPRRHFEIVRARDKVSRWLEEARSVLSTETLASLESLEWVTDFADWPSAARAEDDARRLHELARSVAERIAEVGPAIRRTDETGTAAGRSWTELTDAGWPTHSKKIPIDLGSLQQWLEVWAEVLALPQNGFNPKAMLARRRIRATLGELEKGFRSAVPLDVWRLVGPLNDEGRDRLARLFDPLLRSVSHSHEHAEACALERHAETALLGIGVRLSEHGIECPRGLRPLPDWVALEQEIVKRSELARSAATAWRARTAYEAHVRRVTSLADSWHQITAVGTPLAVWSATEGRELHDSLRTLRQDVASGDCGSVYAAIDSGLIDSLLARLNAGCMLTEQSLHASELRDAVPTELDRIAEVWSQCGTTVLRIDDTTENLPDVPRYRARVAQLDAWLAEWHRFSDTEKPELKAHAAQELTVAIARLQQALVLLPTTSEAAGLKSLADPLMQADAEPWPIRELKNRFRAFTPQSLSARLETVQAGLTETALEEARKSWAERLGRDESAIKAVSKLLHLVGANGQGDLAAHGELFRDALRLAPIWIATSQNTKAIPLLPKLFDLVVIDEASQCTLTNLLPIIFRAKRLVVIGDPQQLPAITVIGASEEKVLADRFGVREYVGAFGHDRRDLYAVAREALPNGASDVVMLDEHYRSDPLIIGFANRHVYQRRLKLRRPPSRGLLAGMQFGVHRIPVHGSAKRQRGSSWVNELEARAVVEKVRMLIAADVPAGAIGVVTPFTGQKFRIRDLLEAAGVSGQVLTDTAFGFQGDERSVIIFSAVVSNDVKPGTTNWVQSPANLLNVALTRARDQLFVVANFDYCAAQVGLLSDLSRYLDDVERLRASDRAELALFNWMTMEGWVPAVHDSISQHQVTFIVKNSITQRAAVVVRKMSHTESPRSSAEQARDAVLEAAGYRVVEVVARDVLETPTSVMHRIRSALSPDLTG